MHLRSLRLLLIALALASTASIGRVPPDLLAHITPAPLAAELATGASIQRGNAQETELRWTVRGHEVQAWLLVPRLTTPSLQRRPPLVIFLHSENSVPKPRMFIDEGVALANERIASLHISLPFAQVASPGADDAAALLEAVRRVQEALTFARKFPSVNGERVALVGHRYGAIVATVVAALDASVDALALLAPPGKPSGWLQVSDRPAAEKLRANYDRAAWGPYLFGLAKFDPEVWLPHAAHAKTYFQFAAQDDWTTTLEQVELYRAAKGVKERHSYEADSSLNAEARIARLAWIKRVVH